MSEPIGHETGHNLQTAWTIVRLRAAMAADRPEQCVGRAADRSATRFAAHAYIPDIRRGGTKHGVSVLARRGAEQHQILDSFEGVRAADSTLAAQLAAITGEVTESKSDAGHAETTARLRVAASAFGS